LEKGNKMQYILRVNKADWSDEFNTFGMMIHNELAHTRLADALHSVKDVEQEWGFGSNQYHEDTIGGYDSQVEKHILNQDQADVLLTIFPGIEIYGVGQCADMSDLIDDFDDGDARDTPEVREYWRYKNEEYQKSVESK
jgi:hypothetical protein